MRSLSWDCCCLSSSIRSARCLAVLRQSLSDSLVALFRSRRLLISSACLRMRESAARMYSIHSFWTFSM